ncbi:hypothetical protein SNEBB_008371 [Seison nebaliae]|nr:hypothetical protein SNEBB_008371 [Seison nebaliae]
MVHATESERPSKITNLLYSNEDLSMINQMRDAKKRVIKEDGTWYIISKSNDNSINRKHTVKRIILPSQTLKTVIQELHNDEYFMHRGYKAMLLALSAKYMHPKLKTTIRNICHDCEECKRNKVRNRKMVHKLRSNKYNMSFDNIQIDIKGPLVPSHTCQSITHALHKFIAIYGTPLSITTDAGAEFRSKKFEDECFKLGICLNIATPEHHQTIGQVERSIRTVSELLRICIGEKQDQWESFLDKIKFTLNNSPTSTTGFSPSEIIFRKRPNHPNTLLRINFPEEEERRVIDLAKRNLTTNRTSQSLNYSNSKIEIGDVVRIILRHQSILNERSAKLSPLFSDPYIVEMKFNNGNYETITTEKNHRSAEPQIVNI